MYSERTFTGPRSPTPGFLRETRHALRGAMHVVIGMSKVLTLTDTLTPSQRDIVATIGENADRALMLAESMFDSLQPDRKAGKTSPPAGTLFSLEGVQGEDGGIFTPEPGQKPRALLVEDSEGSVLVASSFLERLGYDCHVAKSGPEALKKFCEGRHDVIIMDIKIPGMDGLETARRIRTLEKEKNMEPTPILAVTGYATTDNQLFYAEAGINDCLSKPFEMNDLARKLLRVAAPPAGVQGSVLSNGA